MSAPAGSDTDTTAAPIELFGHYWHPTDTPDGFAAAVAWMAAHALDTGTETES